MTHSTKFIESVLRYSVSDSYGIALNEWEPHERRPGRATCACGRELTKGAHTIYVNKHNDNSLVIGECCIRLMCINALASDTSELDYLRKGIAMSTGPGARDYLKYETATRIDNNLPFNILDLAVLQKVTCQVTVFKAGDQIKKSRRWIT